MRNLKKVLSLVLALAMVLSICMVGASAVNYDQFNDKDEITKTEAVAALVNLDVINGYNDGAEFRPAGNVTRAEMVTMICRVLAGGDNMIVNAVKEVPTYSDIRSNPSAAWAESYIEYCTSLGIVSGKGNGIFDPMADVTAAEAAKIVMTAAGYNADIEGFKGIGWDINTMAKANTLKLLNNLQNEVSASQPVTREQVAQLIYNALTIPMVQNYNGNMANTWIGSGANAYQQTLMEKSFGAKKVTGIVVANEWASLDAPKPIKAGTTKLYVLDNEGDIAYDGDWSKFVSTKEFQDETLTVNVSTTLEQVGSSVTVLYKTDTRQSVFGIVMDSELNHVVEFTKGGKIDTKDMEFGVKKGTTYFVNYEYEQFGYDDISADLKFVYTYFVDAAGKQTTNVADIVGTDVKTVRVDQRVTDDELELIKAAYNQQYIYKDAQGNKRVGIWGDDNITYTKVPTEDPDYVTGPLTLTYGNNNDPVNNDYTWTKFTETFLDFKGWTSTLYDQIDEIVNGNYAKLVDCDNDGVAEFFFEIDYVLDELTNVRERDGQYEYSFFSGTDNIDTGRDGNVDKIIAADDLAKNDIVVYTIIDGIAYVDPADMVTATVKTVSYRSESITTNDGDEYFQSGIVNATDYAEYIVDVDEKVDYEFFFDKYGYIRAYRLVDGQTVYGLLTEAYTTNEFNKQYVKNTIGIVELKPGDEKIAEYKVDNYSASNPFFQDNRGGTPYNNLLTYTQDTLDIRGYNGAEFVWTNTNLNTNKASTNVAKYVMTDDGVKLTTASKRATNRAGEYLYYADTSRGAKTTEAAWKAANPTGNWATSYPCLNPVMAVDYVQLDVQSLNAGAWRYDAADAAGNNFYVNAVHDTEYYLVTSTGVKYFTDYTNLPKIDKDKVSAMYAVAENTEYDSDKKDYWVANVIVIELTEWDIDYDSVGLLYNNPSKTIDTVRYLDTLNSVTENPSITLVPADTKAWAGQWVDFGFYELRETKVDGTEMSAESIKYIDQDYAAHGIYAGEVKRVEKVDERGGYIVVDESVVCRWPVGNINYVNHGAETATKVSVVDVPVYIISASNEGLQQKTLRRYDAKTAGLATGDEIIWVTDGRGNVSYIVLVNDVSDTKFNPISWLRELYLDIVEDRNHVAEGEVIFYGVSDGDAGDGNGTPGTPNGTIQVTYAQAVANDRAGKRLVVTNATNVTLKNGATKVTEPAVDPAGVTYTLSYVDKGGNIQTLTLTQSSAHTTTILKDKDGNTVVNTTPAGSGQVNLDPTTAGAPGPAPTIYTWLSGFYTEDNAGLVWLVKYTDDPVTHAYDQDRLNSYDDLKVTHTSDIAEITAVVSPEHPDRTAHPEVKISPVSQGDLETPDEIDASALASYKTSAKTDLANRMGLANVSDLNATIDSILAPGSNATAEQKAAAQTIKDELERIDDLESIPSTTTPTTAVTEAAAAVKTVVNVTKYRTAVKAALKTALGLPEETTDAELEAAVDAVLADENASAEAKAAAQTVKDELTAVDDLTEVPADNAYGWTEENSETVTVPDEVGEAASTVKEVVENNAINASVVASDRYADAYKTCGLTTEIVKSADGTSGTISVKIATLDFMRAYQDSITEETMDLTTPFGLMVGSGFQDETQKYAWYGPRWLAPEGAVKYDIIILKEDGKTTVNTNLDRDVVEMDGESYAVQYFNVSGNLLNEGSFVSSPDLKSYTRVIQIQFYDTEGAKVGDLQTWTMTINA